VTRISRATSRATVSKASPSKRPVILARMRTSYVWLLAPLAACTASASAVEPPATQFFYPTAAAVAPDDSVLFVTNGNSDLTYDSGTVSVVDLNVVDSIAGNWTASGIIPPNPAGNDCSKTNATGQSQCCFPDPTNSLSLICDETQFMVSDAGARIGNFATDIAMQDTENGTFRLIIPTRGDPSITWVDWSGTALSCNSDGKTFELCDDDHRIAYLDNNQYIGILPDEPFFAWASSSGQFAVVSMFDTGDVTLISSPIGSKAVAADLSQALFNPDPNTGLVGAAGVGGRLTASGDIVYVGGTTEDRIQTYTVGHPVDDSNPFLIPGQYFFLDAVGGQAGDSEDTRGITFSPDSTRMYLINRDPPSLQIFDTSLNDEGTPANVAIGAADLCREANLLQDVDSGDGDRIYVSCFQDGVIDVLDPNGGGVLIDQIESGSGPYAVAASVSRKKLYVTNFLDDTVSVIDIAPGSPTRDRVVLRIGTLKPPVAPTTSSSPIFTF
jgi:DNA-binding beta-propeller fold protein YncE